jgi:hypothetical protein
MAAWWWSIDEVVNGSMGVVVDYGVGVEQSRCSVLVEVWSTGVLIIRSYLTLAETGRSFRTMRGGGKRNRTRTHATVIGRSGAARSESRQGMQTGWRKGDKIQYNVQYI